MKLFTRKPITWTTTDEWTGVITTHSAPAPDRAQRKVIAAMRAELANPTPVVEEW